MDSSDSQFPFLQEARTSAIKVTQYPGETIFVPSGWYHQVINHG
jgi:oxalate decarboxylase/phosphoglucose isomerase-like protein (cupin superfamily)